MPPPGAYAPVPPRRPLGVTILSILSGLAGLAEIIAGIGLIGVAALGGVALAAAGLPTWIAGFAAILGGVLLLLGLVTLAVAIGLWRMRGWAWWIAIIVNLISVLIYAATGNWFGVVLPVIILIYLVVIRDKFGVGGRPAGM
jgi:hypothetical protein